MFQFLGEEGLSLLESCQIVVGFVKGSLDGVSPHAFLLDGFLGCFFSKFSSFHGHLGDFLGKRQVCLHLIELRGNVGRVGPAKRCVNPSFDISIRGGNPGKELEETVKIPGITFNWEVRSQVLDEATQTSPVETIGAEKGAGDHCGKVYCPSNGCIGDGWGVQVVTLEDWKNSVGDDSVGLVLIMFNR